MPNIVIGGKFAITEKSKGTHPEKWYLTNGTDHLTDQNGNRLFLWRESPRYDTTKTIIR